MKKILIILICFIAVIGFTVAARVTINKEIYTEEEIKEIKYNEWELKEKLREKNNKPIYHCNRNDCYYELQITYPEKEYNLIVDALGYQTNRKNYTGNYKLTNITKKIHVDPEKYEKIKEEKGIEKAKETLEKDIEREKKKILKKSRKSIKFIQEKDKNFDEEIIGSIRWK